MKVTVKEVLAELNTTQDQEEPISDASRKTIQDYVVSSDVARAIDVLSRRANELDSKIAALKTPAIIDSLSEYQASLLIKEMDQVFNMIGRVQGAMAVVGNHISRILK